MLFNSLSFLVFFPITALLYFLLPYRARWLWLLGASAYFYMSFIPYYILFLLPSILTSFAAGLAIAKTEQHKKKIVWLTAAIITVMSTLFIFKYYNFAADSLNALLRFSGSTFSLGFLHLALPLGISFHSFQAVSYVADVYKGKIPPERHLGIYSLYILFFPQLVAGPIERAGHMLPQFREKHDFSYDAATEGLKLMLWGFFKKIVVADRLALFTDAVFDHPHDYQGWPLIIGATFFAFQIYCDFSGYTDIALGAARFMGYRLTQNFNRPYAATGVAEFWTRWHMTLYSWFKDYIYIPLGGGYGTTLMKLRNILSVFALSGLWHGANWTFVIWGLINGACIAVGVALTPLRRQLADMVSLFGTPRIYMACRILTTFVLITLAWVFFRAHSISDAVHIIHGMFLPSGDTMQTFRQLSSSRNFNACFVFIAVMEIVQYFMQKAGGMGLFLSRSPVLLRWGFFYVILFMVIFMGRFDNRTFIYFQF